MKQKNRVGLGTFPFSGDFSEVTRDEAKQIVLKFLELGGYYIDTAPLYGFGEVENLLGEALENVPREKYFLISKCGIVGIEEKVKKKSGKYDDVIIECYKSLERLKAKYIELYLVHSPDPNTPFDETIAALTELKTEGKIRQVGVSNVTLEELEAYNTTGIINFIQNRFSLINRSIALELESYLSKNSIKLIPYNVLDQGQLTDKIKASVVFRN
jgi:aryl-alcohol dehydrogenase-like predicted oxidoreductase